MPDPQRCPHCAGTGFLPYISELEAQAVRAHKRYLDAKDVGNVVIAPSVTMKSAARSVGYTGNPCTNCGGWRMRRNGTCEVCDDCGTTTGCS